MSYLGSSLEDMKETNRQNKKIFIMNVLKIIDTFDYSMAIGH
jgi:hypothetical protein